MSSRMATVCTCCIVVLLLTMFPCQALAGRYIPAGPPAGYTQTAPGRVQVPATVRYVGRGAGAFGDAGTQFKDSTPPPHRKILVGFKQGMKEAGNSIYGHRLLVGSSPPTCQGKCGSCNPCNPIHVSIGSPHGALTQQEYYPEVWRCKCGNRLFMP